MIKFVLIILIDILLLLYAPQTMNKSFMSTVLLVAGATLFMFFSQCKDALGKIKLRHSVYFVICFSIVFFQCNIDYVASIIDNSDAYLWINEKYVPKSLAFSNIILACFCVGNISFTSAKMPNVTQNRVLNLNGKKYLANIVLLLLGVYLVLVPKEFLNYGYERGVDAGNANLIMAYLQAGFIAMFTLYSMDYKQRDNITWVRFMRFPLIISLLYVVLVLVTGRRTEAIRIASLIIIAYIYCKSGNVNYRRILIFGILSLGAFSIIGVLRSLSSGSLQESARIISEYTSVSPFTRELAGSVNTLHIAMANYPDPYEFNFGETFIPSFFKIIPGLTSFWENYIVGHHVDGSNEIFTSIYFSGDKIWGLGSNIIADVYISFGIIGTCLVFFIFGRFVKYLEIKTFIIQSSPYILALSFSSYSAFMFACRSTMATIFLCWTYSCLLIYIFTRVATNKS